MVFERLLTTLNFIASLLIAAIMLLITTDVAGRVFFHLPLPGVPELTKFSVVCIVWMQMAYTLRARHHLRTTLFLRKLPGIGKRTILVLNCVAGAVLMALIAYYSYPEMLRSWRIGAFEGEHPVRIPTWPIWMMAVVGSALTAIEYVLQAVQALLGKEEIRDEAEAAAESI
jgi:TRAP-type C4-dicarboxylate transport system permease small subunit